MRDRAEHPLFGRNKLKLGTFCTNTLSSFSSPPDAAAPQWSDILKCAQMADAAGFEAIVPIARWKGYIDDRIDHRSNYVFDAYCFAAALAQATSRAAIFATTHAPIIHPVAVAKSCATIDQISGGRFALNVVGGWNRREFEMFGIEMADHSERYAYLEEWLNILRSLWTAEDELDWDSPRFHLRRALCRPQPVTVGGPPIMNAGYSERGQQFTAANSDIGLVQLQGDDPDGWSQQVRAYKDAAAKAGNPGLQVWTNAEVVQAATDAEAYEIVRRYQDEYLDQESVDGFVAGLLRESGLGPDSPAAKSMREKTKSGTGYPLHGSAETIARKLEDMSNAGIDGVLLTWVEPLQGIPLVIEHVLPLLERSGVREMATEAA